MGDHTRLYVRSLEEVRPDHLERYLFAGTRLKGRVLDAACGCGYGTHILKKAGCDVTGVDIDPTAIEFAERHWEGAKYACLDLNSQTPHEAFDAVVSFETLEHLVNPGIALKGFWKIAPMLICSVPNELLYPFRPETFKRDLYPHQRHYMPHQFSKILEDAGWGVEERHCQENKSAEVKPGIDGMFLIYVCKRD